MHGTCSHCSDTWPGHDHSQKNARLQKGVNCTVCNVVGWASAQIGCVPVTGFAFNSMRAGVNASFSFDPTRATSAFIAARQLSQALHFHAFDESEMLWSRMPPIIIILRRLVRAFHVSLIFILVRTLKILSVHVDNPFWVQVFWCQWNMAAQALLGILDHNRLPTSKRTVPAAGGHTGLSTLRVMPTSKCAGRVAGQSITFG